MSLKHIFARKDFDVLLAEMAGDNRLRRVLGPVALTSLGVGAIIGAGIFVLTGVAAADDGGPAIVISFAVAAVGCTFAALCYAEFAAMAPVAGSVYAYAYTTLGEIFAWIVGWDLILEYSMGCAVVASSWSGYLNEFLNVLGLWQVPPQLCSDPFTEIEGMAARPLLNLPSVLIMILVTVVLVVGIRESARTNAALVMIKVAVVLFVIAVGSAYVDSANWHGIPVSQRVLPQERMLPDLVKNYLRDEGGGPAATAGEGASPSDLERREIQLRSQLAAAYRVDFVQQESQRLLQSGRISMEEADRMVTEIAEKVRPALPQTEEDRQIIAQLLPTAR